MTYTVTCSPNVRIAARIALLGLLVLALWNPDIPWRTPPQDVILLLDESLSMDKSSSDRAWTRVSRTLRTLPADSRLAMLRFGTAPVLEFPLASVTSEAFEKMLAQATAPGTHPLDPSVTDIAAAVQAGLRLAEPGRSTSLLLISDGHETQGGVRRQLEYSRAAGIPVYALQAESDNPHQDSWIQALQMPDRIRIDQQLPVSVTVSSLVNDTGRLQLLVDGEPRATREVTLDSAQKNTYRFVLEPRHTGAHRVSARLEMNNEPVTRDNLVSKIVNVEGSAPVLYVSTRSGRTPLADSLYSGGRELSVIHPDSFMRALEQLPEPGVIILDDIAIADIAAQGWQRLDKKVRRDGTGLVVLGGARSFGGGAYRHSQLEALLPVTTQARDPQPKAALLFMVDTSGSMDRNGSTTSRLALARRAIQETAKSLLEGDLVGLLAFDAEPRLLLPLGSYPDAGEILDRVWQSQPAGGTDLQPALTEAVDTLAAARAEQRILVLISDGFVGAQNLQAIERQIADAGIDVIAMAVGEDADHAVLARLAAINDGQFLRIGNASTLPGLMRSEVEKRRPLAETGTVRPLQVKPFPFQFTATGNWPPLSAYRVTRARPSATVYLRAANGDPLLAAHQAGAGRVLVLPGGLGAWAQDWGGWPPLTKLTGGLLSWVSGRDGMSALHLDLQQQPGELRLAIDTDLQKAGTDKLNPTTALLLREPSGRVRHVPLLHSAPGRYTATLPVTRPGRYRVTAHIGDYSIQHDVLYADNREVIPPAPGTTPFRDWFIEGLVQPWPAEGPGASGAGSRPGTGMRGVLIGMTSLLYLLLILFERRPDIFESTLQGAAGTGRRLVASLPLPLSTGDRHAPGL
ncbi:MAG: VWA domain-containing protein [Gammaproteobacteria bacterium]|nr:MAG: VWA domain-containing protein [Gammaproteobacteria bacterium]